MAESLLVQSLVVILAAVATVAIFTQLRLPAAIGYLLAGLIIGPHGLGFLAENEGTRFLADLGLIFLMFMVGLEFSMPTLIAARRDVLGAGTLQVGATVLAVAAGARLFGADWQTAVLLGGVAAMSSTAIVLKQLAEQGEISSQHGRLAIGMLVFQDLATIPLLVIVDAWSARAVPSPLDVVRQLAIAAIALAGAAFIARPLFAFVLPRAARTKSAELFLLAVLLLALGTALGVHLAGLAPPIGAFLAGMVIGESEFRHQVEDDIRPFRDVLVGLFFITIGMGLDPAVVATAPFAVLLWILVFVPGKALLTFLVGLVLRWSPQNALRIAVVLAHGGEFGLLLLTLGLASGVVPAEVGQPALVALAISMGIAPLLIQRNAWVERLFGRPTDRAEAAASISEAGEALEGHVILCGCGRVGRLVAVVLEAANLPYLAIESDVTRFREAKQQGHNVVFGHSERVKVLEAAGIRRARLVVITFDRRAAVERILHLARQYNPAAPSLVSTRDERDMDIFAKAGATTVFPENLAAGLGIADQALLLCGFGQDEAGRIVTTVRAELNPALRALVGI